MARKTVVHKDRKKAMKRGDSKHKKTYKEMFREQGPATTKAKDRIRRDKQSDRRRNDSILDRARLSDTMKKNRETKKPNVRVSSEAYDSLMNKAEKHSVSIDTVMEVYSRGIENAKTLNRMTKQQQAFARVNSFLAGGELDNDLRG